MNMHRHANLAFSYIINFHNIELWGLSVQIKKKKDMNTYGQIMQGMLLVYMYPLVVIEDL